MTRKSKGYSTHSREMNTPHVRAIVTLVAVGLALGYLPLASADESLQPSVSNTCSTGMTACVTAEIEGHLDDCAVRNGEWACDIVWQISGEGWGALPCIRGEGPAGTGFADCGLAAADSDSGEDRYENNGRTTTREVRERLHFCVAPHGLSEACDDVWFVVQVPPDPRELCTEEPCAGAFGMLWP